MSIIFDEISSGSWLRGRDYVGHKVLFVTKRIESREGTYGTEVVATVDFADLDSDDHALIEDCKISDQHITSKLREGTTVVGVIARSVPRQKGYQGAIFLQKLEGAEDAFAKAKATKILTEARSKLQRDVNNIEEMFNK